MSFNLESNMRSTTEAFLHEWDGQWQPDATLSLRAAECEHTILPSTLNQPVRNNEQFAEHIQKVAPLVSEGKMTMDDYLAVPSERHCVCRSSLTAQTPVGLYSNNHLWYLWFDESGTKITKIVEHVDAVAAKELFARLVEAGLREKH